MPTESPLLPEPMDRSVEHVDFSADELRAIAHFRERYENQYKRSKRIQMVKDDIFPAMFNFWRDRGNEPEDNPEFVAKTQVSSHLPLMSCAYGTRAIEACPVYSE